MARRGLSLRTAWIGAGLALPLLFGLGPTKPWPENRVAAVPGGLRLEAPSQLRSAEPIELPEAGFRIELWLEADGPHEVGNRELLALWDERGVAADSEPCLRLAQWPDGVMVRSRDAAAERGYRQSWGKRKLAGGSHHVALVVDESAATVWVDGRATEVKLATPFGCRDGRAVLVIGSTAHGWALWEGTLRALALWVGVEAPDAANPPLPEPGGPALRALYRFDRAPATGPIASEVAGVPALEIPAQVREPGRQWLRLPPTGEADRSWIQRDALRNVLGFVPLGAAVGWGRAAVGASAALGAGLATSLGIETAQVYIPGRRSSLFDLIWNGIGALLGGALAGTLGRAD